MEKTATSQERLAALLFRLARDNVPFGVIEEHVQVVERHGVNEEIAYLGPADPMGEWARQTANRLVGNIGGERPVGNIGAAREEPALRAQRDRWRDFALDRGKEIARQRKRINDLEAQIRFIQKATEEMQEAIEKAADAGEGVQVAVDPEGLL